MVIRELTVESGPHERLGCPVEYHLKGLQGTDPAYMRLLDKGKGELVTLQTWATGEGRIALMWIVDEMRPFTQRSYALIVDDQAQASTEESVVLSEKTLGQLKIDIGGEHFTTYRFGPEAVRPYLHPVLAPGQVGVTRNWPMVPDIPGETNDHPHHTGLWTAHGDVNGVDNWSVANGHGYVIHREFTELFSGTVRGGFAETLDWTDGEKRRLLTETRRGVFYSTSPLTRLFDWEVTLCASEGEVTLADTKEAGLISVRVATSMDAKNGGWIQNAYGACQEAETWGKRAPWCDYSGPVDDGCWGVCLMDHLENPRYPTYWHVRDYGLMTANCFGVHDFTRNPENRWDLLIPSGESRTWRYRVLIHKGDTRDDKVAAHYHGFVNPPQVRMCQ